MSLKQTDIIGKIFGIERLRIETDGPGITTLVGMYKCPLNCEFCINNPITTYAEYTIQDLYKTIKIDSLYFDYSGGGICFGGHEPLLQQDFIIEFIKYAKQLGHKWKFGIETSLNCKIKPDLLDVLDYLIADIKTIDNAIYKRYTEIDNIMVLHNLQFIYGKIDQIAIKTPIIPGYNDMEDVHKSQNLLKEIGYSEQQIEIFEYVTTLNGEE